MMRLFFVAAGLVILAVSYAGTTAWQAERQRVAVATAMTGGDSARAPDLARRYGCAGCHSIPGVAGADGKVAPPLDRLRERVFLGGVARNTADNLVRWTVSPQSFSANTAMPATGISEHEARDLAAYLYAR